MRDGRETFYQILTERLRATGITCQRLRDEELQGRIERRIWPLFTRQLANFINRAKNLRMTPEDARQKWRSIPRNYRRTRDFWALACRAYAEYERVLKRDNLMEFQDLLAAAAEVIDARQGNVQFTPTWTDQRVQLAGVRWLLIDEYQDFNPGFARLIDTIRRYNPGLRLYCVGDDWQAIYRFAGSESVYFQGFSQQATDPEQPDSAQSVLQRNHRSYQTIVETSNRLMEGHGEPGQWLPERTGGRVFLTPIDKFWLESVATGSGANGSGSNSGTSSRETSSPSYDNGFMHARCIAVCRAILNAHLRPGQTAAVLCRTHWIYGQGLRDFREALLNTLDRPPANHVTVDVTTIHRYKGQQADLVILPEVTVGRIPLIHQDVSLYAPFLPPEVDPIEVERMDERHLFYVALSRAVDQLWILSESRNESPFLKSLGIPVIDPRSIDPRINEPPSPNSIPNRVVINPRPVERLTVGM